MAVSFHKAALMLGAAGILLSAGSGFAQTQNPTGSAVPQSGVAAQSSAGSSSSGSTTGSTTQAGAVTSAPKRGMDPKCTEIMQNQSKFTKTEVEQCGKQQE